MSDYKCIVKLKQYTPILHFQHAQGGATLRATEVKPKLDRFLLRKFALNDFSVPETWKKKESNALDYKLRIVSAGSREVSQYGEYAKRIFETTDRAEKKRLEKKQRRQIPGMYYGNMASKFDEKGRRLSSEKYAETVDKTYKEAVSSDSISLEIICFHTELMEMIRTHLEEFFLVTNFGTSQSKGYGSFLPEKKDGYQTKYVANVLRNYYEAAACYGFMGGDDPLGRIGTVYKIMKSGLNFPAQNPTQAKCRRSSLLFKYMDAEFGIGNEKEHLEKTGKAPVIDPQRHSDVSAAGEDEETKYVRALLGIGDHLDFQKTAGNPNDRMSIEIRNKDIDRFPSTIFFKVIDRHVYFVGKRISDSIFNQNFSFSGDLGTEFISTPGDVLTKKDGSTVNTKDFMDGFLAYCFDALNGPAPAGENALTDFPGCQGLRLEVYP